MSRTTQNERKEEKARALAIEKLRAQIKKYQRAEEDLKIKESAMASAINAMAIADLAGCLTYVNPSFLKMWEYENENEVIGKSFVEFIQEKVNVNDIISALRKKGDWIGERVARRKDGSSFYAHVWSSIVKNKTGKPLCVLSSFLDISERKKIEQELLRREEELSIKAGRLEEMNTALKVLLEKREKDKNEFEANILSNLRVLVLPYIERLKNSPLNDNQLTLAEILEANLNDIISPFTQKLSVKYARLTPMEIRIADLIKNGKSNQEIADFLCLSLNTVLTHRFHIRSKLGLKNKKTNLRSYLLSLKQ